LGLCNAGSLVAIGTNSYNRTASKIRIRKITVKGSFVGNDVFQTCRILVVSGMRGPLPTLTACTFPGTNWCDAPNCGAGVTALYDHFYGFVPGTYDGTSTHYPTSAVNIELPCSIDVIFAGNDATCNDVAVFAVSDSASALHPQFQGYVQYWFENTVS